MAHKGCLNQFCEGKKKQVYPLQSVLHVIRSAISRLTEFLESCSPDMQASFRLFVEIVYKF